MSRTLSRAAIRKPRTPSWTRAALAERLQGRLEGPDGPVERLCDPRHAGPHDAVFVRYERYLEPALRSQAGLIVLSDSVRVDLRATPDRALLRVPNLEPAWVALLAWFAPNLDRAPGIHPSAQVHASAYLEPGVHIGPNVVISPGVRVGAGSVISAGCFVGEDVRIGANCVIHPNSTVLNHVRLGDRVIVQSGAVIGTDGFGFRRTPEHHHERLTHIGGVLIEDDVEIGANCVIDRGTIGDTRIGARSKLGPSCIVAHNDQIGEDVLLIGAVQLAGSVTIEDRAVLWGQVGVAGHLTIGAGATVTAQSGVSKSLEPGETYRGTPARRMTSQMRVEARIQDLERMNARIVELERKLAHFHGKTNEDG